MSSRTDMLASRSFIGRRLAAALVSGDPDAPRDVLPRGLVAGIVVGAGLLAGSLALGQARSGPASDTAWRTRGSIVVDQSTGAMFVHDGTHLVATNGLASARLLAASYGRDNPDVHTVPDAELARLPMGPARGIPDAPWALPSVHAILPEPLLICSQPGARSGRVLTALVDEPPPGSRPLAAVVLHDRSDTWIVLEGTAHHLRATPAPGSLLARMPSLPQASGLVGALPHGDDVRPVRPPGSGRPAAHPATPGARIGDLVTTSANTDASTRFFVQLPTGLAPLAWVDFEATRTTAPVHVVSAAALSRQHLVGGRVGTADVPLSAPADTTGLDSRTVGVCAEQLGPTPRLLATPAVPHPRGSAESIAVVEQPPDTGLLLRAVGGRGVVLVTAGRAYTIPDAASLRALGYADLEAMTVPAEAIRALPDGPTLSVAALR